MTGNREIAKALGMKLWSTNSFVPQYRSGNIGPWRINPGGQLANDWGYYSGLCLLEMLPSLVRRVPSDANVEGGNWETWMSLTPHEVESQELGYIHARGSVVIMGLGMGWIAANVALNPRVKQVTIVERDPDIILLFRESGAFESIPEAAQRKIAIVNADALEWHPESGTATTFLYADIWLQIGEPNAIQHVRRMQEHVQAEAIYFWGQELAIYTALQRTSPPPVAITEQSIRHAVANVIGLPLLIADDRNYARMIEKVIQNRIDRGLPVEINLG